MGKKGRQGKDSNMNLLDILKGDLTNFENKRAKDLESLDRSNRYFHYSVLSFFLQIFPSRRRPFFINTEVAHRIGTDVKGSGYNVEWPFKDMKGSRYNVD